MYRNDGNYIPSDTFYHGITSERLLRQHNSPFLSGYSTNCKATSNISGHTAFRWDCYINLRTAKPKYRHKAIAVVPLQTSGVIGYSAGGRHHDSGWASRGDWGDGRLKWGDTSSSPHTHLAGTLCVRRVSRGTLSLGWRRTATTEDSAAARSSAHFSRH